MSYRRFLICVIVCAVAARWSAQSVHAAEAANACTAVSPTAANVMGQIQVNRAADCYGGDKDTSALAARVLKVAAPQMCRQPSSTFRRDLTGAAQSLETQAEVLAGRATPEWNVLIAALRRELNRSTLELQDVATTASASDWSWNGADTLQRGTIYLISYGPVLQRLCPGEGCAAAITTAEDVNRLVNLTAILNQCASAKRVAGTQKGLTELDAEWNSYFFKTRSQYVWELALNSARFTGKDNVFAEPPNDQIMLFHPGVAYEYVGGGAGHDKSYEPIVMADLIGYNRFGWSNANGTTSIGTALGASIVATYSPDNQGSHVGYGLMVHAYNTYSFGVTRRDTGAGKKDTTYLVSVDLMKFLLNPSAQAMQAFRGAGAPAATTVK
ncbi:MAG TPA: hypothetical protein VGM84_15345 [Steroidobacteraceae bacterium]|jgi:hypothetical protein